MKLKKLFKASLVVLLILISFTGCFGTENDESKMEEEEEEKPDYPYEDVREFLTIDLKTNETYNTSWAIFKRAQGGNGAEHYLATTHNGWITNLGGEYPTWSQDRGLTWQQFKPVTDPILGLGEGAIIEAPDGDILAMSWYPYSGDEFYAYFYDISAQDWRYMYNRLHAPFYDRPWIAVAPGPLEVFAQEFPWASIVTSNFWDQMVFSVDGLTYYPLEDPSAAAQDSFVMSFDITEGVKGEFDYLIPHREMWATPLPQGGLLIPRYFGDLNAYLDNSLTWHKHEMPSGTPIPAPHLVIDSSGALHSVERKGNSLIYHLSLDGGETWLSSEPFSWGNHSQLEEWEFKANGEHELAVIYMRVEVTENGENVDKDLLFQIKNYRESLEPDTLTMLGLGDVDATAGLGNDLRFDFASLAILPDGGVIVAYQDSTDPDPLFALELEMEN